MPFRIDDCPLIGTWRIMGSDIWDRDHLDMVGPARMIIGNDNHGEIAFGALQASLDVSYSQTMAFFEWHGFDEMDEVLGDDHAELSADGFAEITLVYRGGDEAVLKAVREKPASKR